MGIEEANFYSGIQYGIGVHGSPSCGERIHLDSAIPLRTLLYGDQQQRDNQGAIALANNPEYHVRTKHIDIQYHFIRECVQDGKIDLQYCPTEDMLADGMTKALARDRHLDLLSKMGVGWIDETAMPSSSDKQTARSGNSRD